MDIQHSGLDTVSELFRTHRETQQILREKEELLRRVHQLEKEQLERRIAELQKDVQVVCNTVPTTVPDVVVQDLKVPEPKLQQETLLTKRKRGRPRGSKDKKKRNRKRKKNKSNKKPDYRKPNKAEMEKAVAAGIKNFDKIEVREYYRPDGTGYKYYQDGITRYRSWKSVVEGLLKKQGKSSAKKPAAKKPAAKKPAAKKPVEKKLVVSPCGYGSGSSSSSDSDDDLTLSELFKKHKQQSVGNTASIPFSSTSNLPVPTQPSIPQLFFLQNKKLGEEVPAKQQCVVCNRICLKREYFQDGDTVCVMCRVREKTLSYSQLAKHLRELYIEWRKKHKCMKCGIDDWRIIVADHDVGAKEDHKGLARYDYWAKNGGVEAYLAELKRCTPKCQMHHNVTTNEYRLLYGNCNKQLSDDPANVKRRQWRARVQKYAWSKKIGSRCAVCNLKCTYDLKCGFEWDHLGEKKYNIGNIPHKHASSYDRGKKMLDEEVAKCRLLCGNCHHIFTHYAPDDDKYKPFRPVYIPETLTDNMSLLIHPHAEKSKKQMETLIQDVEKGLKRHATSVEPKEVPTPKRSSPTIVVQPEPKKPKIQRPLHMANPLVLGASSQKPKLPHGWFTKDCPEAKSYALFPYTSVPIFDDDAPPAVTFKLLNHERNITLEEQGIDAPAQGTDGWFKLRKGKISGSKLTGFHWDSDTEDNRLNHHLISTGKAKDFFAPENKAKMEWGNTYEDTAMHTFLELNENYVNLECPFIPHSTVDWLGASPDGQYVLLDDNGNEVERGALEIKCPGKKQIINKPVDYYLGQLHLEMAVLGHRQAVFIMWEPNKMNAFRVKWDEQFWKTLCILMKDLRAPRGTEMPWKDYQKAIRLHKKNCDRICSTSKPLHPKGGWKLKDGRPIKPEATQKAPVRREMYL